MDEDNKTKEDGNVTLPSDVIDKMSDQELDELFLGDKPGFLDGKVGPLGKIVAVLLWIASLVIQSNVRIPGSLTDPSGNIMMISTVGMLLVVIPFMSHLSSYTGPVWPITGRFGQQIDKPTPLVMLRILGYLFLLAAFAILCLNFFQG